MPLGPGLLCLGLGIGEGSGLRLLGLLPHNNCAGSPPEELCPELGPEPGLEPCAEPESSCLIQRPPYAACSELLTLLGLRAGLDSELSGALPFGCWKRSPPGSNLIGDSVRFGSE